MKPKPGSSYGPAAACRGAAGTPLFIEVFLSGERGQIEGQRL